MRLAYSGSSRVACEGGREEQWQEQWMDEWVGLGHVWAAGPQHDS